MIFLWLKQAFKALKFLHTNNIAHHDIKPENMLICEKFVNNEKIRILKICDFGESRLYN